MNIDYRFSRRGTGSAAYRAAFVAAALASLIAAPLARAQHVGKVSDLTGVLVVRSSEGVSRLLAADSTIRVGDTLTTDAGSHARIRFDDDAEFTLAPRSVLVVTRYAYDAASPRQDAIELGFAQGGFESRPGLVGQRSPQATLIRTPGGSLAGAAHIIVSLQP